MSLLESYHTLSDSSNGREMPWAEKKLKSHVIESSFSRLGFDSRSERMSKCGDWLEFKLFSDESKKLHNANFCRLRLCPMCAWRRSLKVFGQVSKVMDEASKDASNRFLFLTLTIRNVEGSNLSDAISELLKGYLTLTRKSRVKKSILGAFRTLEVTRNADEGSEYYGTYHPHIHAILLVKDCYFHHHYISQSEWSELWKDSLKAYYQPIIHIHKVKCRADHDGEQTIKSAIAEVSKYSVKDSDYVSDDIDWVDETVSVLDKALANRRLVSFSGELDKIAKKLKLDDAENGDLINTDNEEQMNKELEYVILCYSWHLGSSAYFLSDVSRPSGPPTESGPVEKVG